MDDKSYEGGYIKLYRKMVEWKWFKDSFTVHVFLYLLLSANWKDVEVCDLVVKRGQILTSQSKIAETLGISRQNVRTALNHLKSTNELTIELTNGLTNKAMLITVENYEKYQADNKQLTNELTNELTNGLTNTQPTPNQCLTTNEEREERKKDKKYTDVKDCTPFFEGPLSTADMTNKFIEAYPPQKIDNSDWIEKAIIEQNVDTDTFIVIMRSLEEYKNSQEWTENNGQFIPKASRFISNRKWERKPRSSRPKSFQEALDEA